MSVCSIDITAMTQLQDALISANTVIPTASQTLRSELNTVLLSAAPLSPAGNAAAWVPSALVDVRRRLALAIAIQAASPGFGQYVQFDESVVSSITPEQARANARRALDALAAGDRTTLASLLENGAYDPYFADEFARGASPQEVADLVLACRTTGSYGAAELVAGLSAADCEKLLTGLGQTLGTASRGTGELAQGADWQAAWINALTFVKVSTTSGGYSLSTYGAPSTTTTVTNVGAPSAIQLVFSRGTWSTAFLKEATTRIMDVEKSGNGAWFSWNSTALSYPTGARIYTGAIDPAGNASYDPMVALMAALSRNKEAAQWAFTQGGAAQVPLGGENVPVNGLMNYLISQRSWPTQGAPSVIAALTTAVGGNADSGIAKDAKTIMDSLQEQKEIWDATPWYKKFGHLILDIAGVIPGVGEYIDAANAAWYVGEGDWANAGLTAMGVVPLIGDLAKFTKYARALKEAGVVFDAAKLVDRAGNAIDATADSAKLLGLGTQIEPAVFKFDNVADFNKAANLAHPNVVYEFNGIRYITDTQGRPVQVYGTPINLKGTSDPKLRAAIGRSADAQPGDVGFHLWAESFGGETNKLNVVPGNGKVDPVDILDFKNLNTSEWAKMENQVRAALADPAVSDVHFDVRVVYPPTSASSPPTVRPDMFEVTLTVDGKTFPFTFPNTQVRR